MDDMYSKPLPADDAFAILNLLYRYADALDSGDFDRIGRLFRHADVYMPGSGVPDVRAGSGGLGAFIKAAILTYPPDDTPRTRHVTTNAEVRFTSADEASTRSYFTVFQEVAPGDLRAVITGIYDDRFRRDTNGWYFIERREAVTSVGNLSAHLRPGVVASN